MLGIGSILRRFSGRHHRKFWKRCEPLLKKIHRWDDAYGALSDAALAEKTGEFRSRLAAGATLNDLLPEAFAVAMNAARRLCGKKFTVCGEEMEWQMVPYDVQLMGGIALHFCKIAEMATGEGKTLVATLPLYLNALDGKNCQLVTVNDYLARRDAEWMGKLFQLLGLTVGCIQNGMDNAARKLAYGCDITYGTAAEFGFDYLRDNGLAHSADEQVQRGHHYCIVDEIDSVLIDEARTPLIISGPVDEERRTPYQELNAAVENLTLAQLHLCNRLVAEAKDLLEKDREAAVKKLYAVHLGMPKHRQLLKLLESSALGKQLERLDGEMNSEMRREERFQLKESLYFTVDERQNAIDLTELGRQTLYPSDPDAFVLPDLVSIHADIDRDPAKDPVERQREKIRRSAEADAIGERIHCIGQLIRAHTLYERDQHYIVHEGQVVIVDSNTGRAMVGRRWSDGLHQAIEAKERLAIRGENRTYATITIQNYFRLYGRLAGMTGTAETEAQEFYDIYHLSVVVIPPNRPCRRLDANDEIYKTRREKYAAVLRDIEEAHGRGQPILVGTTAVETSELLAKMLQAKHLPHTVLNAKFHEAEARIIAQAGGIGAVTIATNMAGRGTDIRLADGVAALGGLKVLGTERHESRRIDRQLRGRCARQGDPGSSKFYVSLEDDLMRLFASRGPIAALLDRTFHEGDVLAHPMLNRSIANAQRRVEQQNYALRKRLLEYDDVLNVQREIIYGMRNEVLRTENPRTLLEEFVRDHLQTLLRSVADGTSSLDDALAQLAVTFPIAIERSTLEPLSLDGRVDAMLDRIRQAYRMKELLENPDDLRHLERFLLLLAIDRHWQGHLTAMDDLRRGVNLRSYAQKNPLFEYKAEAFCQFEQLLAAVRREVANGLFRSASSFQTFQSLLEKIGHAKGGGVATPTPQESAAPARQVGRNDVCPCGSGKKYKKCCGTKQQTTVVRRT
ncbi:MAG: preprotein translocase subunit SecA [Puniceicoccales bacterium]|jgi:preprotein translocase subunit SecA|nr:preprotein translocase subunit SecA [Puniceicoccales bacterium]